MHLSSRAAGILLAAGAMLAPQLVRAADPATMPKPPMMGYDANNNPIPFGALDPTTQPKFKYDLPQPIFHTPDTSTFPGFDYYEIGVEPVDQLPVAFPQPSVAPPPGYQWLGIVDAQNQPLFTPLWGYSQLNGGLLAAVMGRPVATYPSMSFKAQKGRPVKVKWVNNTPDWHVLCPYPNDATQPCAIDRTLMGTRPGQQPDNAIVVHLHGGEIPPDADGFAELWIGNATTAGQFSAVPTEVAPGVFSNMEPPPTFLMAPGNGISDGSYLNNVLGFDLPGSTNPAVTSSYQLGALQRPVGNSIYYNYPMVQDAATIWYHDHALGKTRINVVAGPAGYFYVEDPAVESKLNLPAKGDCSNEGIVSGLCYDVPVVFQDRSFNDNGTFNFPNGLGQANAVGDPLNPGDQALHPQWVPEYFGDHSVVNGVIWPRLQVEPRAYRFRFLNGSNARCYTFGLKVAGAPTAPAFQHIASEQGYLPAVAKMQRFTMCPGERMDLVIDFSSPALRGKSIYVTNSAGAPYPNGVTPQDPADKTFAQLANLMRFDVVKPLRTAPPAAYALGLPGTPNGTFTPAAFDAAAYNPPDAISGQRPIAIAALPRSGIDPVTNKPVLRRELFLNEVTDANGAPTAVQINGKPFEAMVTETPERGTVEVWDIINTTVDAHPIHLHLVQFQVIGRRPFNTRGYSDAITQPDGSLDNANVALAPFLFGAQRGPDANEVGWKDTVKSLPGEVTTIVARWDGRWPDCPAGSTASANCVPAGSIAGYAAPQAFFSQVTSGPYVWHCHIVDHEDNEMMRPALVLPALP